MTSPFTLHIGDWLVIGLYMLLALSVGFAMKSRAGTDRCSYFLAGRSLPWWWIGASMAATTFGADTPLVVTSIIASKGLSVRWIRPEHRLTFSHGFAITTSLGLASDV